MDIGPGRGFSDDDPAATGKGVRGLGESRVGDECGDRGGCEEREADDEQTLKHERAGQHGDLLGDRSRNICGWQVSWSA